MARRKQSGIYLIRNSTNGRCYIGSTGDRRIRWAYHRWQLRKGTHPNQHLQAAWNKYSEPAFEFIWIQDVPVEFLLSVEQEYLEAHASESYNVAKDARAFASGLRWSKERRMAASIACTGRTHTPETRKKIGDVQRGKPKGPRSPEHCRKLGEAMKGKRNGLGHACPPEARQKSREANLGNKHFLGKKHTDETKRKISSANSGRVRSAAQRRRISEGQRGRKQSEETRAKRSASLMAYNQRKREQQATVVA